VCSKYSGAYSVDYKRLSFIHTKYILNVRMNLICASDTYVPCYKVVTYMLLYVRLLLETVKND
jgi:hypothetical protein